MQIIILIYCCETCKIQRKIQVSVILRLFACFGVFSTIFQWITGQIVLYSFTLYNKKSINQLLYTSMKGKAIKKKEENLFFFHIKKLTLLTQIINGLHYTYTTIISFFFNFHNLVFTESFRVCVYNTRLFNVQQVPNLHHILALVLVFLAVVTFYGANLYTNLFDVYIRN